MSKNPIENRNIHVLIYSHGIISGAFRMMMDILENIDRNKFRFSVAYKPEYSEWGTYETDCIRKTGAQIIPLRGKRLFDFRGFIDLWKALHKEKIDILHCWDVLGIPGRIIGKLARVKVVESLANPPPELIFEISLKHYFINKMTSVFVDGFIACSKEIVRRYQEQKPVFLKAKVVSAVYNCVRVPELNMSTENISRIRRQYGLNSSDRVLTNIGYFNVQKAQNDLLYAFKNVVGKKSDARLFIIGWGTLEKDLKDLTANLGLTDRVIFTGKLARPQVFEILSITDLFVLSSHWEGFGIVLTEAMALRKPVVSTDTDGSREVIENGKTGILVPTKNPPALAQAILALLEKPDLMAQMGEEGFRRLNELFNCEQYIKGYEDFYKAVLSIEAEN